MKGCGDRRRPVRRAYEIKHDGFRFVCRRDGDRVRVFSRRRYDWTDRVQLIAEGVASLRVKSITLIAKASSAVRTASPISVACARQLPATRLIEDLDKH